MNVSKVEDGISSEFEHMSFLEDEVFLSSVLDDRELSKIVAKGRLGQSPAMQ